MIKPYWENAISNRILLDESKVDFGKDKKSVIFEKSNKIKYWNEKNIKQIKY